MNGSLVSVAGISKRFGGVRALIDVSIDLNAGEIHALLGENGAGKSTLTKILSGVHRPDEGSILVNGVEVYLRRPADAIALGVAVVPQERTLVPSLSVAENILLGRRPTKFGIVDQRRMRVEAQVWLDRIESDIDPRQRADTLRVAEAQMVEIARALAARAAVLVLDEPTASLGEAEINRLFIALRRIRDDGAAVVFVSHKLDEVLELCDRATILRDGEVVAAALRVETLTTAQIIDHMVGRTVDFEPIREASQVDISEPVLELENIATSAGHDGVSLSVHRGEVVGVYGLVGAGRTELAHAIIGATAVTSGTIKVNGESVTIDSVRSAVNDHGIAYLSEDRKEIGLVLDHPIFANTALAVRDRLVDRFGWLGSGVEAAIAEPVLTSLSTKYVSGEDAVSNLSGGNQQKVSLAKWLASEPQLLIVDEPTVGIDVATKDQIHRLLRNLSADNIAVVVISSELPELVRVADKIVVMGDFSIKGELANDGDYESISQQAMRLVYSSDAQGQEALV